MKIGILGSGEVGQALGRGFAAEGHEVRIGTREPQSGKLNGWMALAGPRASVASHAQTSAFGEVLVLATPWSGTKAVLDLADPESFSGKTVIDVTNPLVFAENGPPSLALGYADSGGEQVQRWLPDSKVVKAFNIVGNPHMHKPQFPGGPPTMFIAGNDDAAKKTVTEILTSFGWETMDAGGIESSRMLEPVAMLWIVTGIRSGKFDQAFKMLRK